MAKKSNASKKRRKNLTKKNRNKRIRKATESVAYEALEPRQLLTAVTVPFISTGQFNQFTGNETSPVGFGVRGVTGVSPDPQFLGFEFNESASVGGFGDGLFGPVGAEVEASAGGRFGIEYGYFISEGLGSIVSEGDFRYEISPSEDPANSGFFSLTTDTFVEESQLQTLSPTISAYVDLIVELDAELVGQACAGVLGCVDNLDNPVEIDVDQQIELLSLNRQLDGAAGIANGVPVFDGDFRLLDEGIGGEAGDLVQMALDAREFLLTAENDIQEALHDLDNAEDADQRNAAMDALADAESRRTAAENMNDTARDQVNQDSRVDDDDDSSAGFGLSIGPASGGLLGVVATLGAEATNGVVGASQEFGSLTLTLPEVNLSDSTLGDGDFFATTEDGTFDKTKSDIARLDLNIGTLLSAYVPGLGTTSVSVGPVEATVTTVEYTLGATLDVTQDFQADFFREIVTVDFGTPVTVPAGTTTLLQFNTAKNEWEPRAATTAGFQSSELTFVRGTDIEFRPVNSNVRELTADFELGREYRVNNDIGLGFGLDGELSALAASLEVAYGPLDFTLFDIGPLFSDSHDLFSTNFPAFSFDEYTATSTAEFNDVVIELAPDVEVVIENQSAVIVDDSTFSTDGAFTFDAVVTNRGLAEATNVSLTLTDLNLEDGTNLSQSNGFQAGDGSGTFTWTHFDIFNQTSSLAPGESVTVTFSGRTSLGQGSDFTADLVATSTSEDGNPDNNTAATDIPVRETKLFFVTSGSDAPITAAREAAINADINFCASGNNACTLREAVFSAQHPSLIEPAAIQIDPSVSVIELNDGITTVGMNSRFRLIGNGSANTLIKGNFSSGILFNFDTGDDEGNPFLLQGVTIAGEGTSSTSTSDRERILASDTQLVLDDVVIEGHTNTGNSFGGALFAFRSDVEIRNSRFIDNDTTGINRTGGGIAVRGGNLLIENSEISGNEASLGGAIYARDGAVVTINNSLLDGNEAAAGAAIFSEVIGSAVNSFTLNDVTITNHRLSNIGRGVIDTNTPNNFVTANQLVIYNTSSLFNPVNFRNTDLSADRDGDGEPDSQLNVSDDDSVVFGTLSGNGLQSENVTSLVRLELASRLTVNGVVTSQSALLANVPGARVSSVFWTLPGREIESSVSLNPDFVISDDGVLSLASNVSLTPGTRVGVNIQGTDTEGNTFVDVVFVTAIAAPTVPTGVNAGVSVVDPDVSQPDFVVDIEEDPDVFIARTTDAIRNFATINWNLVADTEYFVRAFTVDADGEQSDLDDHVQFIPANSLSGAQGEVHFTNLISSTEYKFSVESRNAVGASTPVESATLLTHRPPPTPVEITSAVEDSVTNDIVVQWKPSQDADGNLNQLADGYRVFIRPESRPDFIMVPEPFFLDDRGEVCTDFNELCTVQVAILADPALESDPEFLYSFTIENASAETSYEIEIHAVNAGGTQVGRIVVETDMLAPGIPTNVTAHGISPTRAVIEWDSSFNATEYQIVGQRQGDSEVIPFFTTVVDSDGNVLDYTPIPATPNPFGLITTERVVVDGLTPGENYTFRVIAANEDHNTVSEQATAQTGFETPGLFVTTADDVVDPNDFQTSLREAVNFANSTSNADTIRFDIQGVFAEDPVNGQTIQLDQELHITESLTIVGDAGIQLSGQDTNRLFYVDTNGINLTLQDLVLQNGRSTVNSAITNSADAEGLGGAIFFDSNGALRLTNSTVRDSNASSTVASNDVSGGGIHATGAVFLTQTAIVGNTATGSSAQGGGVYSATGIIVENSFVDNNNTDAAGFANVVESKGGGLSSLGQVRLENTTVSNNAVLNNALGGGGVYSGSFVFLDGSVVDSNSATGSGAAGGGVYAASSVSSTRSTVSNNSTSGISPRGGGVATSGAALTNTTFAGNQVFAPTGSGLGGGLYASEVNFHSVTFTGNRAGGGGAAFHATTSATLTNSIVLGNSGSTEMQVVGGTISQTNNNIFGNVNVDDVFQATVDGAGILGINGASGVPSGPVETIVKTVALKLAPSNPALDLNDSADGPGNIFNVQFDARGESRQVDLANLDNGGTFDAGAFEAGTLLIVDSLVDSADLPGSTTLREAINIANEFGDFVIEFADQLSGQEIELDGELRIETSLDIVGPGANLLTISGGAGDHRVVLVNDGDSAKDIDVSISGLTIANGGDGMTSVDGAGINSTENLTLTRVTLENNQAGVGGFGGGLRQTYGSLVLRDSTLSTNSAGYGGGIHTNYATVDIANSTFSSNSAVQYGGAISNNSDTIIRNSTITGNRANSDGTFGLGGGIDTFRNRLTIHNSIVAGNYRGTPATQVPNDFSGYVSTTGTPSSNNLIGHVAYGSSAGGLTHGTEGNIVGNNGTGTIDIDTILNTTLALNGGTTATHALVVGSLAIDAGNNAEANDENGNTLTTDQRGDLRDFDGDGDFTTTVDIGSFEFLGAQTFVVDTLDSNDDGVVTPGNLSLREALRLADANNRFDDTITFDPSVFVDGSVIELASTINVTDSVTITGFTDRRISISGADGVGDGPVQIFNLGGALPNTYTIENIGLIDGFTTAIGGAIVLNDADDSLIVDNVEFMNNHANGGGAIFVTGADYLIKNSSFVSNTANFSGSAVLAINTDGLIINSTFSDNDGTAAVFAQTNGSAIATTEIRNSTIAFNDGAGLLAFAGQTSSSTIEIGNSIVSNNTGSNAVGTVVTLGNNISDDGSPAFDPASDLTNTDPLLTPLTDNGSGDIPSHGLTQDSPAIGSGNNGLALDENERLLAVDQRGEARIQFGTVDVGAFESGFDVVVTTAPVVTSVVRDEGGVLARPDLINTYAVTFDQDVNVMLDDLLIVNELTGDSFFAASLIYDSSSRTATWDLSSLTLDAAFYSFQLSDDIAAVAGGLSLDGDGDGTAGGLRDDEVYVAIPGDANLDGQVNVLGDAFALVANLGTTGGATWAQGDFNGDGNVNVLGDAFILVANLNRDVRPPATATLLAKSDTTQPTATSFSSKPVAASLQLDPASGTDDENDTATDSGTPAASQLETPQLVLAGDHDLRDDIFGSEF